MNEECNGIVAVSTPEDFLKWFLIRRRWEDLFWNARCRNCSHKMLFQ